MNISLKDVARVLRAVTSIGQIDLRFCSKNRLPLKNIPYGITGIGWQGGTLKDFEDHKNNKSNPHEVTCEQMGASPTTHIHTHRTYLHTANQLESGGSCPDFKEHVQDALDTWLVVRRYSYYKRSDDKKLFCSGLLKVANSGYNGTAYLKAICSTVTDTQDTDSEAYVTKQIVLDIAGLTNNQFYEVRFEIKVTCEVALNSVKFKQPELALESEY